jgi:N-methylhydantoinase A/oxoprolinase/acetone carboxylase beta subunit
VRIGIDVGGTTTDAVPLGGTGVGDPGSGELLAGRA